MSDVLDRPNQRVADATAPLRPPLVPPLVNGDYLTRDEFHRRYEAMGRGVRAELIEGVVVVHQTSGMASSVSLDKHSEPHSLLHGWAFVYFARTPGLRLGIDGTIFADLDNEAQPDVLLGIPESLGGQTRVLTRGGKQYLSGVPELVGEVAASTSSTDLNAKLKAYQRNGVREYIVLLTEVQPPTVRWLVSDGGRLSDMTPDPADGLLKSRAFPGLWLDADALLRADVGRLVAAVERGCATPEFAAFAEELKRRAG